MTLQQLRYLIEIADKGSINKASKSLFVSQPSLSNAIMEVENELHITIFNRTNKGVSLTIEGAEFLAYARQIVRQAELLEKKYAGKKRVKQEFSVSTQHCPITVLAFGQLIKSYAKDEYEFKLKETKSFNVIDDVSNYKSEVGVIYVNEFNKKAIHKQIKEGNLEYQKLTTVKLNVLVNSNNNLIQKEKVKLKNLEEYPCLLFEEDEYNLFYFSEEILSSMLLKKVIKVSERATLFNLMSTVNGFTISTEIISERLRNQGIVPIDLEIDNRIHIGTVVRKNYELSQLGENFIEELKKQASSML